MRSRTAIALAIISGSLLYALTALATPSAAISIMIERADVRGSYPAVLNGTRLRAPAELLDRLGNLVIERGHDDPVIVLFSDAVPLRRVSEVIGLVQKAGFTTVRCFYFPSSRRLMTPINFGPAVPFSHAPP